MFFAYYKKCAFSLFLLLVSFLQDIFLIEGRVSFYDCILCVVNVLVRLVFSALFLCVYSRLLALLVLVLVFQHNEGSSFKFGRF